MLRLQRLFRRPQQPPKPPFTDDQISERAHTLWQARQASGKTGTAADDWEAAKVSLQVEQALPKRLRSLWSPAQVTEAQKTALELRKLRLEEWKVWIAAFGVLATVLAGVGLYLTYRSGQEQQQLNTERLVTDRFAKAVEQLGNGTIDVRIGAIYSLERIARDSPKDHWTIMEVLTAFVRNKSPLPKGYWRPGLEQELPEVTADMQSALTVIGRRRSENDPLGQRLDLRSTNLRGAWLVGANLRGADFLSATLFSANLEDANLEFANLNQSNLGRAGFSGANLRGASLIYANLIDGILFDANLTNANLEGAYLTAYVKGANLQGANLQRADLKRSKGLTPNQVKAANNWQDAQYDPEFRKALGLPPEKPKP